MIFLSSTDQDSGSLEENTDVGSFNHAKIQANLAYLLKRLGSYAVLTDLSLDVSSLNKEQYGIPFRDELRPDICLYSARKVSPFQDILRMKEMPLLIIEILSPKQSIYEITEKFKAYFDLGILSCWLVIPPTQTITIYHNLESFFTVSAQELNDQKIGIQLLTDEIFE